MKGMGRLSLSVEEENLEKRVEKNKKMKKDKVMGKCEIA